ncbi:MAG: GerMN domain-containing protein [Candidatus Humimicrobiaceae bacterium]
MDPSIDSSINDAPENGTEENSSAEKEITSEEETSTEKETTEEQAETEELIINIYYSDQMAEYLIPESRIISSENKFVDSLFELMKKPIDSSLTPLIPDTTTINSVIIEEGNAKVDLSQELLDDRFVSDTVDILLLYSIVNTLTQFQEINSVTIYINGEKLDILGQLDIKDPVFRRNDLIKDNQG